MVTNRFLRISLLAMLTLSTGLAGCAPSDDLDEDEPEEASARSSEEMLSGAGIVPQVSIRGIELDMTTRDVRRVLGKPDSIYEYGDGTLVSYKYGLTTVYFDRTSVRVSFVHTRSPGVRTKEGVGTGSLKNAVDALPDTRCFAEGHLPSDGDVYYEHVCEVRSSTARTAFFFGESFEEKFGVNDKVRAITLTRPE
jgi:hypothetical protein